MKFERSKDHRICHYVARTAHGHTWHVWRKKTEIRPRKYRVSWLAKNQSGDGVITAGTLSEIGAFLAIWRRRAPACSHHRNGVNDMNTDLTNINVTNEVAKTRAWEDMLVERYQAGLPLSKIDTKEARRIIKRRKQAA